MSGFSFGAGGGEAKKPAGAGGFSFGGAQPTATPAAGGTSAFSFGTATTPAATTTTSTAAPSFSFGTAATPAATTTTTSTAAPSFSFGTKPASTTTTTSTGGGLFGAATTATTTTGGAGLFGAAPAAAAPAAPAAAATTTGGGGLFGAAPAATPTAATPAAPSFSFGAAKPATTTPAAEGSGLFGAAKPATTTTEAAKPAATGGSLFGAAAAPASTPAAPTTTTAAAATTTKATSSALAPPPVNLSRPTDLVGKSVGETLQYWNKELAQRTADFKKKAQIIADWDEQIVERRRELFEMQVDLVNAKSQQDVMERQIRVIEQHQEDTERALTDMENGVDRLYQQLGETLDVDRDVSSTARLYGLAEQVSGQILQIGNSLRDASKTISRYQAMQEQRGLRKGDGDATRSLVSALNNQLSALKHIDRQLDLATNRIEKDRFLSSSK
ncbi:unnamed protein product [Bathycoccus prasinos]